jgi:hypothetical protein
VSETKLAKRDAIQPNADTVKKMAMEIGKDVAFYIETQFPEAVSAASSSFLLSLRNHTYNSIMGAIQSNFTEDQQIALGEKHRRTMRRIKKAKTIEEIIQARGDRT